MNSELIFHQLFEKESSTFTYLLGDPHSRDAVLIDPVLETLERDLKLLSELSLNLKYVLETHVHADHITASGVLRARTKAQIALGALNQVDGADLKLQDGQQLNCGSFTIKVISTPGHTNGCVSYLVNNWIFTGDALLIRGCGRTDFQEGSAEKLFHSVREVLFQLPNETQIFPAHDYKGFSHSTIAEEKQFNPRLKLSLSKEDFISIMSNLHLDYPKKIDQAVPANLHCGFRQL